MAGSICSVLTLDSIRMLKKSVQQGRSERRGEAYRYVEPLSDARTPLADFFSILRGDRP